MVNNNAVELDFVFHALSDRTRRAMLQRLSQGTSSAAELAAPHTISLPAISKHLKILERAHLVERRVKGRVHEFSLNPSRLQQANQWILDQQKFWEASLTNLEMYLTQEKGEPND